MDPLSLIRSAARRAAVAVLALLVVHSVHAQQELCYNYKLTGSGSPAQVYEAASPSAACSAYVAGEITQVVTESGSGATYYKHERIGTMTSATESYCYWDVQTIFISGANPPVVQNATGQRGISKTAVNCQPTCPPPGSVKGSSSTVWYATRQASSGSLAFCTDGCLYEGSMAGQDASGTYFGGPATSSGANCTDGPTSPNTTPSQAPPGKCPGTVNGATVYVPCDKTWSAPKQESASSTSTGASGSTSTSSTGTTTQTTCNAATCTTTTTTTSTNPDGAGGTTTGTSTSSQPRSEYCAKNPGDPQCNTEGSGVEEGEEEEASSFGGSCGGGFSCDGDAVQCAMAAEQHRRNCQLLETPTTLSSLGEAAATGTNPSDHPRNQVQDIAVDVAARLNGVPLFGSTGQCPQDVTFSSQGHSFSLPFSVWCPYLQMLGAAFMAACYLAAAFIIFRRD